MSFPTGTHDDMVDTLIDLVVKEIVPDGSFLNPMDVSNFLIKDHTYAEDVKKDPMKTGQSFLDMVIDSGVTYRGKPKDNKSNIPSWAM